MKTFRTALLLGFLAFTGCASPFGARGYYRYPPGITKQCHLKVDEDMVTVIVLEDQNSVAYPSRIAEGKIVVNNKQGSVFTPRFMKLIDQRNRVYRKVLSRTKLKKLKEVEQEPQQSAR